MSRGTTLFRKNVNVFVYVGGVDFAVNDRLSVGVRARRLQYPSVEVGPYVGETLRSHVPNLRLVRSLLKVNAESTDVERGIRRR